ncbi:uncharacterized protein JCM6883_005228 [Sporobolomyces salmoneus]|uniref:uncharacterized protein n=1 Tax=Sporobolomyces salmoneus TaxID=183962 RepID=UPI003176DFB9
MSEPSTPRSLGRSKAPDSPLHPSRQAESSSNFSPLEPSSELSATGPTTEHYDSEDEELVTAAQPTITKGSHRREGSSAALLSGSFETPPSPRTRQRQRRLREYREDNETAIGPLASIKAFAERNSGLLCIATAQMFFAVMNLCVKILVSEIQVPIWELILVRMGVTAFFCVLWLKWSGDPNPLLGPPGVRGLLCIRGIVGFFGLFPVYYVLQYLSLSDATTIGFLSPVLVGLFAFLLLKEPYTRLEATVGFTSLIGVVFIAKPSFLFGNPAQNPDDPLDTVTPGQCALAVLVALVGVCGAAGAYLIIRLIGKRASATHSILYFSSYSVIVSCIYPLVFDSPPVLYLTKRFFILLVPIGVFGFIAQVLLTTGLQRERAGRGSLAIYTHLIFAMILERLWFKTLPDAWSILGAVIIVGGALRVALAKQAPQSPVEESAEAKAERGVIGSDAESDEEEFGEEQRRNLGIMLTWLLLGTSLVVSASSSPTSQLPFNTMRQGPLTRTITPTNYTIVDGFFHQSSPTYNGSDPLPHSFGLIDTSKERWSRFQTEVDRLNEESDEHTSYKVFWVARHGQGWHNVAEAKYGTEAWNNYWSMEYGDGNMTWGPDPDLTPLGKEQAQRMNAAWKKQIQAGVPLPSKLYSSPLTRAASTLEITWKNLLIENGDVTPLFVEHFREMIGVHTCDQRSRKSELAKRFPTFEFEIPFSELDQLWSPDFQESSQQQALRIQQLLNRIFATDPSQYISITAHGGVISSFLRVVNHPKVSVPPGGMIPVVVKAVNYLDATNEMLGGGQSIPRPRPRPKKPEEL